MSLDVLWYDSVRKLTNAMDFVSPSAPESV
jgi:hypothetical protein